MQNKSEASKNYEYKTESFKVSKKNHNKMVRRVEELKERGWEEVEREKKGGKYKGGKGCCLFLIFPPLALLAGNQPDMIYVTFKRKIEE